LSPSVGIFLQAFENGGDPLRGGLLYTYSAGSTTPLATYTTSAGNVAHSNPIVLDSSGRVPGSSEIWLTDGLSYRMDLYDSLSNLIQTQDNITGAGTITSNLAGSGGSALVGFIQAGAGAVQRTAQSKMRDVVSVFDFMTTAEIADVLARTETFDIAAPIQAAVNAAQGGRALYFPGGIYKIGTAIAITSGLAVYGDGADATVIKLNTATMIGFNVSCSEGTDFRDMQIGTNFTASAGAGIKIDGTGGGVNTRARISNIVTIGMWHGIEFVAGEGWIVENCGIHGVIDVGIDISNTVNADGGDNWINNCYFSGGVAASDSIRHHSSGGLQVSKCKFQQSGTAYHMIWNNAVGSSQISLVGNHVEAQLTSSFTFERTVGVAGITGISITDNYFSNFNNLLIPNIWFKTNSLTTVSNVTISGNMHFVGTQGTAIQIDGGTLFTIIGESIQGAAATSIGIATGNATALSIYVDQNHFYSVTTQYSITSEAQLDRNPITTTAITTGYVVTETASGVVTVNAVAKTLKTFAASPQALGVYIFEVDLAQGLNINAAWAMLTVGNAGITLMTNAPGTAISIGVAGLALQVTQTTGVGQTVTWRLLKIGP
jgi:hypothetical protein